MNVTDTLLENNRRYVESGGRRDLPIVPSKHLTIVTCMDSRIDVFGILGLGDGEAHVLRNAGGIVTDDMLRSLIISQRLLDTREIVVIHHTNCGMSSVDDGVMRAEIASEVGEAPPFALQPYPEIGLDLRDSVRRVRESPFIPHRNVRGFVFDVATGALTEVSDETRRSES